jgi:hypothetical protein
MASSHDSPPQDEPKSPLWLPALGAALFLLAGIWWLAWNPEEPKPTAAEAASASAAAAASAAPATDGGAAPAAEVH